jgi:hypothetical protein
MDGLSAGMSAIRVQLTDSGTAASVSTIRVEADVTSLSGAPIISSFLPGTLTSEVEFALEQPSSLWGTTGLVAVTC